MIKAILFDVDGVLVDSRWANWDFFNRLWKKYGFNFISKKDYAKKYFNLTLKEVIKTLLANLDSKKQEKIFQTGRKMKYNYKAMKFPRGEKKIIQELSRDYQLAIVSGRIRRGIEGYLSFSGLRKNFKVVVAYEDYTKTKPDPEPLLVALKRLNLKPQEAIYVGDSQSDLLAAKTIGMKFICFYGISEKIFKEADINIKTFAELPKAIENLSRC